MLHFMSIFEATFCFLVFYNSIFLKKITLEQNKLVSTKNTFKYMAVGFTTLLQSKGFLAKKKLNMCTKPQFDNSTTKLLFLVF